MLIKLFVVSILVVFASGQGEKRPLVKPDLNLCRNRPEHYRFGKHRYVFSWLLTRTEHEASKFGGKVDWLTARNFCRERFTITSNLVFILNTVTHLVAVKFIVIHDMIHE